MKKILGLIVAIMLSAVFLKAQSSDPELDYIKKVYSKEKRTIVDEYMNLDVQEGAKFWTVYGAYETGRENLPGNGLNLLKRM